MVLVRNVFRLKFGKAREALAVMKEGLVILKRVSGEDIPVRLLTDLTGPYYTVVMEMTLPSLSAVETTAPRIMGDKEWQTNYQKLVPLVDTGYREIFNII